MIYTSFISMNTWRVTIDDIVSLIVAPNQHYDLTVNGLDVLLTWNQDHVQTKVYDKRHNARWNMNVVGDAGTFNDHHLKVELVQ
jgi:hypothetical protein